MSNSNETRQAEGVNSITAESIIDKFAEKNPAQMEEALWDWFFVAMASPDMNHWDEHDRSIFASMFKDLLKFTEELKQITTKQN